MQPAQPDRPAQRAEMLINIQQFGRALEILETNASNPDPALSALRNRFILEAAAFEKSSIQAAIAAKNAQRWKDAQVLLQKARSQYVQSKALRDAQVQLLSDRDAQVQQLRIAQFSVRAATLNQEIQQLEKILAITPYDMNARQELRNLILVRPEIASGLLVEAQRLADAKRLDSARKLFALSHSLVPSPDAALALKKSARQPSKPKKRVRKRNSAPTVTPNYEYLFNTALTNYQQSLQADRLLDAKTALALAGEITPAGKSLQAQRQTLQERIDIKVSGNIETGKYQYSLGEIDAAISAWETAYKLAPEDNALGERLQRAHKFRRKYEALKN